MEVTQITQQGTEKGKITLNQEVFGVEVNPALLAQYVHVHNQRAALHTKKTKGRGEVAGGGRKPWRQKGTGRARHGSIRSPLWVGGGHTHPIVPLGFKRIRMSKKMRVLAMASALSDLMGQKRIMFIDSLEIKTGKTKEFVSMVKELKLLEGKLLIIVSQKDENLGRAVANLAKVMAKTAATVGTYDLLSTDRVLFVGDSYKKVEEGVTRL